MSAQSVKFENYFKEVIFTENHNLTHETSELYNLTLSKSRCNNKKTVKQLKKGGVGAKNICK